MGEKQKIISVIKKFLREFSNTFTLSVITFSICGRIMVKFDTDLPSISSIHTIDGSGLPYAIIIQLFVFSIIMGIISSFIFSEYFSAKLSIRWRSLLFLLATLFVTLSFAINFYWFPVNNIYAWLTFVPVFFAAYAIAIGISYLLLRMQDKKYNKLLKEYKNKHKISD